MTKLLCQDLAQHNTVYSSFSRSFLSFLSTFLISYVRSIMQLNIYIAFPAPLHSKSPLRSLVRSAILTSSFLFTQQSQFSFALSLSQRSPLYHTCQISGESRFPLPDAVLRVPFTVLDQLVIDLISLVRLRQLTLCRPAQRLYVLLLCLVQGRRLSSCKLYRDRSHGVRREDFGGRLYRGGKGARHLFLRYTTQDVEHK